jgi:hypothetical protein
MRYVKFVFFTLATLVSSGCASQDCRPQAGMVLQGTDTAIVGLYIDAKGFPQASVETVTVKPGQKIIFAGPDEFEILFKDQRSPIGKLEVRSTNGIVVVEIPKDIFERERANPDATKAITVKGLLYRYGIRVKGKVTDPLIHVEPE